jgi:hypothetical protein
LDDEKPQTIDDAQVLELGVALGQRRAFGMVAGRCSAARAECMRKIRDQKTFLKFASSWEEFCVKYLKIPRRTADYDIGLLKKHGPLYFETRALTGISPAEFERIKGAIQPDGIHIGNEVIALIPENTERAIEAVAQLQAEASAAPGAPAPEGAAQQIAELEKRARKLYESFHQAAKAANLVERESLLRVIQKVQELINRLDLEIR